MILLIHSGIRFSSFNFLFTSIYFLRNQPKYNLIAGGLLYPIEENKYGISNSHSETWFGSLAAIVAWTGFLLALASFVLKDDARTKKGRSLLKIVRGFRLILIKLYNLYYL